jgi:integrase/recombinase XerC
LADEISAILTSLATTKALSEQSLPRVNDLARRFQQFAAVGVEATSLGQLTADGVRRFVEADSASGPASLSTMHLRRSVLRLLFRVGRTLGLVEGDPTLDLELPPKTPLRTRPLDDEEVALCRSAALHTLSSTRLAAAWALAEATCRTAELPRLTIADLDLEAGHVRIHGGTRTASRSGLLSPWGITQLERHLQTLPSSGPAQQLVYRGKGSAESKQASACIVVTDVLTRAGLAREPDVRPLSVAAWAGRKILDETGRIEEVALRLGVRSLDRTAQLIGFDWKN